jgi:hypothetical protein
MTAGPSRDAKSAADAAAEVKARVVATDGEERWILDDSLIAALAGKATG